MDAAAAASAASVTTSGVLRYRRQHQRAGRRMEEGNSTLSNQVRILSEYFLSALHNI